MPAPPMPTKCSRRPRQGCCSSLTGAQASGLRASQAAGNGAIVAVDRIERVAREAFGFEALRPGQREAIEAVLGGRDTLVVMSTGSGKSAIYQIAGLLTAGATVVVSPLIALQRDQVEDLAERAAGGAAQLNSAVPAAERRRALDELAEDALEFLFLAPEQLANPDVLAELVGRAAVAARGRRGALHLRVGPRLPARLPAARRRRRGARAADDPRADRDRGAAGARRDRRAARAARPARARPRLRPAEHPPRGRALPRRRRRRAQAALRSRTPWPRRPSRGSSTSRRAAAPRSWPTPSARARLRSASYHAGMRARRARRRPGALHGRRPRRGGRHDRVRHGHRQGRRALGLPLRGLRVARLLLPGDRARRPRRRARRGGAVLPQRGPRAAAVLLRQRARRGRRDRAGARGGRGGGRADRAGRPAGARPSSRRRKLATALARLEEAGAVSRPPDGRGRAGRSAAGPPTRSARRPWPRRSGAPSTARGWT